MALIIDPDNLTDSAADNGSTNVFINTATKTIKLVPGVGGLDASDGVTEKAVYSFLKEEWKNDPLSKNLAAFDFAMIPITDEFYELVNGWDWADATTRQTIRSGGWILRDTSGNLIEQWANITALGNVLSTDQLYYDLGSGRVNFTFTGPVNEAIQIISDPNGDADYSDGFNSSTTFELYNREQAQNYNFSDLAAVGASDLLAPKRFAFPVGTGTDTDILVGDTGIDSDSNGTADVAPYDGMSITFYTTPQSRTIGASSYDFGIIIDGNNGTKRQIYEFVQWALRQSNDQDSGAGSLNGDVMPELLEFVGATLKTKNATNYQGGGSGVYIDNFNTTDTNDLVFNDNTDTERTFPFVASGTLEFNSNLINDTDAVYRVFFTDGVDAGDEFGNATSILVDDNAGADISGNISGNATIAFTFDYDGNTQGNRTSGTDANITAVAIGLSTGQYVKVETTITRSNANTISFTAALERNYQNP
jgi:hypothetical protein